jgi:hypothetical protein
LTISDLKKSFSGHLIPELPGFEISKSHYKISNETNKKIVGHKGHFLKNCSLQNNIHWVNGIHDNYLKIWHLGRKEQKQ